jgi:hypothetical protein
VGGMVREWNEVAARKSEAAKNELRAAGWSCSMAGLEWLARVGPAPMDAWRCAMGWGERAARSHAMRLEQEGRVERRHGGPWRRRALARYAARGQLRGVPQPVSGGAGRARRSAIQSWWVSWSGAPADAGGGARTILIWRCRPPRGSPRSRSSYGPEATSDCVRCSRCISRGGFSAGSWGVLHVCRHDEQIGRIEASAERAMFHGQAAAHRVDTIRGWAQRRAPDRAQAGADAAT